ncbi:hypothetical protein G7046_g5240 [Stylonectria norvegica]|nr:hypothetical protein G7046_g5240 [Stylonectria norvegica]
MTMGQVRTSSIKQYPVRSVFCSKRHALLQRKSTLGGVGFFNKTVAWRTMDAFKRETMVSTVGAGAGGATSCHVIKVADAAEPAVLISAKKTEEAGVAMHRVGGWWARLRRRNGQGRSPRWKGRGFRAEQEHISLMGWRKKALRQVRSRPGDRVDTRERRQSSTSMPSNSILQSGLKGKDRRRMASFRTGNGVNQGSRMAEDQMPQSGLSVVDSNSTWANTTLGPELLCTHRSGEVGPNSTWHRFFRDQSLTGDAGPGTLNRGP